MTVKELEERIEQLENIKEFSNVTMSYLKKDKMYNEIYEECLEKQKNLDNEILEAKNKIRLLKLQNLGKT